jgi:hypothetical protein
MSDESRALEFEQRLEALCKGDAAARGADALEDLALRVGDRLAPPAPRAAFLATARQRLLRRLPRQPSLQPSRPRAVLVRRLATVLASVLVALSLSTAGVAYAAQAAIPGDTLYGAKRGLEAARWSLTTDPEAQAALLSDLASERLREVERLVDADREALIATTLAEYEAALDDLQAAVDKLPGSEQARVLARATERVQHHQRVLERLLEQVPLQAAPAIEHAIERSSHGEEVLEALQEGLSPSDLAPGQNKTKEPGPDRTPGPPETKGKP